MSEIDSDPETNGIQNRTKTCHICMKNQCNLTHKEREIESVQQKLDQLNTISQDLQLQINHLMFEVTILEEKVKDGMLEKDKFDSNDLGDKKLELQKLKTDFQDIQIEKYLLQTRLISLNEELKIEKDTHEKETTVDASCDDIVFDKKIEIMKKKIVLDIEERISTKLKDLESQNKSPISREEIACMANKIEQLENQIMSSDDTETSRSLELSSSNVESSSSNVESSAYLISYLSKKKVEFKKMHEASITRIKNLELALTAERCRNLELQNELQLYSDIFNMSKSRLNLPTSLNLFQSNPVELSPRQNPPIEKKRVEKRKASQEQDGEMVVVAENENQVQGRAERECVQRPRSHKRSRKECIII